MNADNTFISYPSDRDSISRDSTLVELKTRMNSIPTNREKIDLIFKFWLDNRGRYNKESEKYIKSFLADAKAQSCYYSLGWCYFMLGWLNLDHAEQRSSIALFDKAIENFSICGEEVALTRSFNGKAAAFRQLGQFDKAITIFNEALERAQKNNNKELIITIACNIAVLLIDLRQYEEALEYFSLAELMTTPQTPETAIMYINYGKVYRCLGDLEKAEEILLKSLSLSAEKHHEYAKAYGTLEMGYLRQLQGNIKEAESYFRWCLEFANLKNFPRIKAISLLQLGKIESEKSNVDKSIEYLEEAGDIFHKIKAGNYEAATLLAISTVYEVKGDYAKALAALKQGKKLEKEAFNEETISRIGVLKVQQAQRENLLYKDLYNRIATISQIGQAITSTFDIKKIGAIIYEHMKNLIATDNLALGLLSPDEKEIIYKIYIENGKFMPEFTVKLHDGFMLDRDNSFSKPETIIINQLREDKDLTGHLMNLRVLKGNEINSLLICPLIAGDKVLGFLTVQSKENDSYSGYHVVVIKALAAYVSIAVENEELFSHLSVLASTDHLTKLANRRSAFQKAVEEFDRYKRYKHPFAVIMADIDKFKKVNDEYGHGMGDTVLKSIAGILCQSIRTVDVVGRIGGEEFLLLLPDTNSNEAAFMAERIRNEVAQTSVATVEGEDIITTISFGVAEVMAADRDVYCTVKRADQALYKVKASGGNAVRQAAH